MDHKRNLLIAAMAVISYFMLLAWNKDYPTQAVAPAAASSSIPTPANVQDIPVVTAASTANSSPPVAADTPQAAAPVKPAMITVNTPVQHLVIDLVGGDIVSLSLPRYPAAIDTPAEAFQLLKNDATGVYVAQSGLVGRNGIDASSKGRPHYSSAQSSYEATSGDLIVDLTTTTEEQVAITKRFIFSSTDYLIRQQYIVVNNGASEWRGNVFGQIKHDDSKDPSSKSGVRLNNFFGAVMTSADDPYIKVKLADVESHKTPLDVVGGWIAFSQHYFLSAWVPAASEQNKFSVKQLNKNEYLLGYVGPEKAAAAGQTVSFESALWAGPKNQDRLEEIAKHLGLTIDYGMLWFVGYPIFQLLTWIHSLVNNYGLSIILLTVVIRSLFYPLSAKQFASSAGMKRIQPKLNQLKERYGEDKQKLMAAQMELWKKEGVSPFSGCLPMLLQMPVFLGIYWVLNESVELRQAPFILWYRDLSAIDPYFLLPILLGGVNFLQQHMNPMPAADPMQAKMMKFTPVIFTIFFLWMPAGLVTYYLASGLLGLFQQWFFNVRHKKVAAAAS
jgi:YidC/Oxa1 family membrane protein insertase